MRIGTAAGSDLPKLYKIATPRIPKRSKMAFPAVIRTADTHEEKKLMRAKTLAIAIATTLLSFTALADDGGDRGDRGNNNNTSNNNSSLQASVIGSMPGEAIGGVLSGGAPWVVAQGSASVSASGRIQVEVQGLLITTGTFTGTTGPVTMVGASLVCGGAVALDNGITPSPLSSLGNAEINQVVTVPPRCIAPVVLVRISTPGATQLGPFIAATGLTSNAGQNQNQNDDRGDDGAGHR